MSAIPSVSSAAPGQVNRQPIQVMALMEALSVTGPAKNLMAVARALAAATPPAAKIRVVTFVRDGGSYGFIDSLHAAGIEVDAIRERRRFDLAVIPQLRDLVRLRRPDLIQTHNIKSHFLVRLGGIHRRLPWIAFAHGYTAEDGKVRLYNQLDRWSLRGADRVVAVCEAFAADLRARGVGGERIMVRHNSISPLPPADPGAVTELREKLGIPAGAVVWLAVGRMSPEKGHADLLEAIAALQRDAAMPDFRLVLVGDGPDRKRVQDLRKKLLRPAQVILAGSTSKVPLYYALADALVLPSHSEGSPKVLLEGMISGLPIVATRVGGVPELAEDGATALLVPARDIPAMSGRMRELSLNRELRIRLGARARQWALAHYSPEQHVDSIFRLYQSALESRAA